MRVDPFSLTRPPRSQPETREFVDTAQPDVKIRISLRALSTSEAYQAVDLAEPFITEYVTGNEAEQSLPAPGVPVAGQLVKVTKKMVFDMASLQLMQVAEREEDIYDIGDLIAFSEVMPTFLDNLMKFADEVKKTARVTEKKDSGAAAGIVSRSDSDTRTDTLTSTPESSLSSGASTSE